MTTTVAVTQSPSPPPTRLTAGSTTDGPFGLFANSGFSSPFFYQQFQDDFYNALGATGLYASTVVNTGVAAVHVAGDGGIASFATSATGSSATLIQLPAASVNLPGQSTVTPYPATSVKKLFYLARINLSDITTMNFIAGLCNTGATFAAGVPSVTDGIYFSKTTGSAQSLVLTAVASAGQSPTGAGVTYTVVIPTNAYSMVNATYIDLGFYMDRQQNLMAFVGNPLMVGYAPQSGAGVAQAIAGNPLSPPRGAAAAFQQATQPYYWSLANLNLTLGCSNGVTASVRTMLADFHCYQKER